MAGPATQIKSNDLVHSTPAPPKDNGPELDSGYTEHSIGIKRGWFFGQTIAFAINDYSIEMAVVSSYLRRVKLIDTQKQYIPSGLEEAARWDLIDDSIAEYLETHSTRYSRICITLSGPETSYRTFLMPQLNRKQLASAIPFEIKKQLPFPVAESNYDYRTMSRVTRGDQTSLKISLAAATKSLVERIIAPVEKAGRKLAMVYNAPEAVGQLLTYLPNFDTEANYALICIDREQTLLSFYCGSDLVFYHSVSLGSSIISGRTDSQRFDDFAQLLATEVQNSLDYFAGQLSSNFSNKLFIYGDMAYSDELIELMSSHLGFEFCRFPAEELGFVAKDQNTGLVSLSASLQALGAAVCNHRISNLLPPDRIEENKKRATTRLGLAGLSLMTLVLLTSWLGLFFSNRAAEESLVAVNQIIAQFHSSEIAIKLDEVKAELAAEQIYLTNTREKSAYVGFNLKELSLITPRTIQLQMLEIDRRAKSDKAWRLVGTVNASDKPNEIILAEYVDQLENSQFFKSVSLERYRKKAEPGGFVLEFELIARSVL